MMKLTRRYFLQGIGASAVLGTLTGLAPTKALAMNSYGANTSLLAKRAGTIKYSSCLRNCADRCLMKFSVQNGRMTYVRGADEQYKTGSCPCVKGLTYVEYTYAPDRILHPMVRVGEKGSHKWRRITREEAWDNQAIAKVNSVDWKDIERVTGLTQKQIEEFADVYGHAERIIIRAGYGMQRNYNGARMTRAIAIMQAMRGMFDKPSCGIIYDNVRPITGMNLNLGRGNYLRKGKQQHVNMTDLDMALKAENPTTENRPIKPIHLLVIYNGNPVAVSPNVNAVIENLKRKDLFVVGFDMIMTDSLEYCDLILPASTQFETDDIIGDYHSWYVQICEKVIEPVGESKPNWDFFAEWGRRMGFKDQAFRDTPKDIIRQFLQTETPWYQGITLERLEKEKFIHLDMPESVPVRSGGKAETESSKIELYSNIMKKAGFDPVIDLALCEEEMPEEEKNLPFRLLSPGIPQRVNSSFYNVKYIRAYNAYECEVNPEDAKRLGIKSGDKVRLNNQRGEAFFVARVTTRVAPGVVRTAKCNWRSTNPYGQNTNTNSLTTGKLTDMGGCSAYHSTRVNLSKA